MLKHFASSFLSVRGIATAFIVLCMGLSASRPGFAQDTVLQQYEVELVIFRVTNPTGSIEDWALEESRAKSSLPATRDTDEPGTGAPTTAAPIATLGSETSIQPLESGRFKLTPIDTALKRNRNYQWLAHIGWTQPGFALESPRPFGIENLVTSDTGITGTVTLTRGRYLRLVLDLVWQSPDGKRYVLREQRRMRSDEKHYFDHPYFGVVALISKKGT